MKHTTRFLLILALVATVASAAPGSSQARRGDGARSAETRLGAAGDPTQQSWWGAAAAFGCRQGFRYIGSPAFTLFSGFCVIALVDAILS